MLPHVAQSQNYPSLTQRDVQACAVQRRARKDAPRREARRAASPHHEASAQGRIFLHTVAPSMALAASMDGGNEASRSADAAPSRAALLGREGKPESLDSAPEPLSPAEPARADAQEGIEADGAGLGLQWSAPSSLRTLWKGTLLLYDGTQLPGASITTTMQPWAHLRGASAEGDTDPRRSADVETEAEAELCFTLEMVRHQPLRISPLLPEHGVASAHGSAVPRNTLAASGAIQLRLDAAHDITVAYMEQALCWGHHSSAVPLAPDAPVRALLLTFDPSARAGPRAAYASSGSSGVLDLVVLAQPTADSELELVVGRRLAPPQPPRQTTVRPDDPHPRLARLSTMVKTESEVWASSDDDEPPNLRDRRVRRRGQVEVGTLSAARTGHTPGRRGEKRPQKVADLTKPHKRDSSSPHHLRSLHEELRQTWRPFSPVVPAPTEPTHPPSEALELSNRALIKRLIKHQLLGRGMERDDKDHGPCFQAAYAGTCLVFVRDPPHPARKSVYAVFGQGHCGACNLCSS